MSIPLLRAAELRLLETRHAPADPPLMERAGRAAAALACSLLDGNPAPVLVFAGPGNNGGDALVLARVLKQAGRAVHVVFRGDPENLPPEARLAYQACRAASAEFFRAPPDAPDNRYSLVIDGLFGIGLTRPPTGEYAAWIERINRFDGPVLALDVPSGLAADTGVARGSTVRASHTLSFIAGKPGLYTLDGPDHAGKVILDTLGLTLPEASGALLARADFAARLNPRPRNSHKGSFGSLAVIGGARGMSGAALLAGRAALKLGAGRVYLGLLEPLAVDPLQPELMLRPPESTLENATAAVIGPGLGQSAAALDLVRRLASAEFSVLFDADALNLLAAHPVLAARLAGRPAATLLTPHPAEAARLLGLSTETVQADRITAALTLAQRFKATVALKGCGTVLALPDGRWRINTSGNPGLASAGTGDV
ncbi:MAG: bifunctional ADP-dependent NAD(P)H-hydrate dehydratase/NAD(P)H-hydrate epimerase, partial [Betaproteobacteria bacterium HGW-Betaproteobacteria-11]